MKKLLTVLLSFLLVPSALASADAQMSDADLAEYFIFEEGTWWEYKNYIEWAGTYDINEEILMDERDDEDANVSRMESWKCNVTQCFALAGGGYLFEYFIEDGNIYLFRIAETKIENILTLSLDGISTEVGEIEALFYGYESISGLLTEKNCEVDLDSSYEFEGRVAGLLTNTCAVRFTDEAKDEETLFVVVDRYVENVGLVQKETRMYENNEWQYTTTMPLYDTSIDIEKLANSQEVELSSDDELLDQNIEDYVDFGKGTWWEYETTIKDMINGTTDVSRKVDIAGSEEGTEVYVEDNVSYATKIDGIELSKEYIMMDLNGFEQEIEAADYAAFGLDEAIWGEIDSIDMSCEYELGDEAVELENEAQYEDAAIIETCVMNVELASGNSLRLIVEGAYIKGLGASDAVSRVYVDNTLVLDISVVLKNTSLLGDSVFNDMETDEENYAAIQYLYNEGIVGGYDDGSFKPGNTVNRAELLKILVEGQGITPDADTYKNCFPDVTTDWYAKYVCYAKEEGWVSGYDDGFFRPADSVNKVEALKMLLNSQDIETDSGTASSFEDFSTSEWFAAYVAKAEDLGILEEDGSSFQPDDDRTRAGIAEELYRLLTY